MTFLAFQELFSKAMLYVMLDLHNLNSFFCNEIPNMVIEKAKCVRTELRTFYAIFSLDCLCLRLRF